MSITFENVLFTVSILLLIFIGPGAYKSISDQIKQNHTNRIEEMKKLQAACDNFDEIMDKLKTSSQEKLSHFNEICDINKKELENEVLGR